MEYGVLDKPTRKIGEGWVVPLVDKVVNDVRPVSVEFHEEFHCIKYADVTKRERMWEFHVMWRDFHHYETPLERLPSFQFR
jgi:hypothetical protein